ncbi:MAG: Undecaprenyl-diphosphatase [Parcubacteria group bacterium Gr01-1014_106]|nr:MAG: Undecaprenyl-diphosphatase [Parcubacteria group bacterium Gr01-1014_106]
MDMLRAIVLGGVQGITEFLPISSDGHLLLVRHLFGWADEGLSFDAALHLGTFFAVLVYFRTTWINLLRGRDPQLFWALVVGTIPAGLVGFLGQRLIAEEFRSLLVTGLSFIATAVLLFIASRRERPWASQAFTAPRQNAPPRGAGVHGEVLQSTRVGGADTATQQNPQMPRPLGRGGFTPRRGFLIGCAQIVALLPGLSRSGVTMTAGILSGLSRERAVEFSFLLALPITAAAGLEGIRTTVGNGFSPTLGIGVLAAFLSGFGAIHVFLRFVRTRTFMPFGVYLFVLGVVLTLWSVW